MYIYIASHLSGTCRPVKGVVGAEDITIHPETGIAYISVEIFLLQDHLSVHQKTVAAPALVSPNDLVAVGPGRFKRLVEKYTRRSWSNVLFYTGPEFVEAASGLGYANGINVNSDGRLLYVSTTRFKGSYMCMIAIPRPMRLR